MKTRNHKDAELLTAARIADSSADQDALPQHQSQAGEGHGYHSF